MQLSENWFVDAPWAQLLCSTKIPNDTLQKFIAMSDDILEESDGKGTEEVVPSSWEVSIERFQKFGVLDYTMNTINEYMSTVLSNGNVKQMMDTEISDGPHTQWNSRIVHAWVVSQKENDYIPVHAHDKGDNQTESSKISGILYLKVPEQIERNTNDIAIRGGKDGQIVFTGMGGADSFSTTTALNIIPEAGRLYLFPSSLNHQVYPFRGKGERRSLSFNADVISKKQVDVIVEQEKNTQENVEGI